MMLLSCLVYALLFYLLLIFSWIKRKIRHFFVYYIDLYFCSFLHKLRKGLVTRTDCLMIQLLLYWARLIFFFFRFSFPCSRHVHYLYSEYMQFISAYLKYHIYVLYISWNHTIHNKERWLLKKQNVIQKQNLKCRYHCIS